MPIGLLIGANCPKVLEPCEVISSRNNGPFAFRSCLGWSVVGSINDSAVNTIKCNVSSIRIPVKDVCTDMVASHHFAVGCNVKDSFIERRLNEMYMLDFNEECSERRAMSGEDLKFLQIMKDSCTLENGHYVLPLPFRNQEIKLPNNRVQAVKRAEGMKKRMKKDEKFRVEYVEFMNSMIEKGYAKKVSEKTDEGKIWYTPHHAVYHPVKRKLRVVFDCAAEFQKRSLNAELIQGPDLANLLIGVIIRFRKESIAFTADIESMFFQVRVPEDQQSFLRFLWWENSDIEGKLSDFQMGVHLFGATSSSSCSNFVFCQ